MTWFAIIKNRIAQIAAVVAIFGATLWSVWQGGKRRAAKEAELDDYENADSIRNSVDRDLDKRVREHEGRGFRDE